LTDTHTFRSTSRAWKGAFLYPLTTRISWAWIWYSTSFSSELQLFKI